MKRLKSGIIIGLVSAIIMSIYVLKGSLHPVLSAEEESSQTVLIGPNEINKAFRESMKSAKGFYDLYRQALNKMEAKDYEAAIQLLNASLPYVGIIVERDMVYTSLAEIYRAQGNLESELKYLEAILSSIPKDAPPSNIRENNYKRASEIRRLLSIEN